MSETVPVTTTVMFADICRSTFLFDQLGDQKASSLIGKLLKQATAITEAQNGVALRSLGDDVLCIFSDPLDALQAAIAIHSESRKHSSSAVSELSMKIGINSGSALLAEHDIYGDTVNTAARLSNFAKAGQTIISNHTVELLNHLPAGLIRPVGEITLKGKPGPLSVFELLDSSQQDEITQIGSNSLQFPRSNQLSIRFQSREHKLDFLLVHYLLGRNPDCDLVVNHPMVSRHHAEIRYDNNEFILVDFSTNGTELITNGQARTLHHSQAALRGNGAIYLGRTVHNKRSEITFHASGGSRPITQTNS